MSSDWKGVAWRKAGRSGTNGGECVEVAFRDDVNAVRDSKNPGSVLAWGRSGFSAFLGGVKTGKFASGTC